MARRRDGGSSYPDCYHTRYSFDYWDVGGTSMINRNPTGTIQAPMIDNNGQRV